MVWLDPVTGETRSLTATPGHVMATPEGGFAQLIEMIAPLPVRAPLLRQAQDEGRLNEPLTKGQEFGTEIGTARIVTAEGETVVARAWRLKYAAATAHLFEEAEMLVTRTEGGLAVKPEWKKGWKTWNFEVETLHTYIAGGIRVHNTSENSFGQVENGEFVGWGSKAVYSVWDGSAKHDPGEQPYARSTNDPHIAVSRDPDTGWVSVINNETGRVSTTNYHGIPDLWTSRPFDPATQSNGGGYGGGDADQGSGGGNSSQGNFAGYNDHTGEWSYDSPSQSDGGNGGGGKEPILIDLDGDGLEIVSGYENFTLFDTDDTGLIHRSSWAAAGDGVLFFDADGDGTISSAREYIFTEWDPTAGGDMEALRAVFDSNGDGKLSAADAQFAAFKVMVTLADGSTQAVSLAQAGIASIDLIPDAAWIELPDGSMIKGEARFTRTDGSTGTIGNAVFERDGQGYKVVQDVSTDAAGVRTVVTSGFAASGDLAFRTTALTSADGLSRTVNTDLDGDGVIDTIRTVVTTIAADGTRAETRSDFTGSDLATAALTAREVITSSANGDNVTRQVDSTGGGWFDASEVRVTNADGSRSTTTSEFAKDGSIIRSQTQTLSADGKTRTVSIDEDGNGSADSISSHAIAIAGDLARTDTSETRNGDASLRARTVTSTSADGRTSNSATDADGDGDVDLTATKTLTVDAGGATSSVQSVFNGDNSLRSVVTTTQSADTLSRTDSADLDGDGDIDLVTASVATVSASGRTERLTLSNGDGSIRSMAETIRGADGVSLESRLDLNGNGVFEAHDLAAQVTVNAAGERIADTWTRSADGTLVAHSHSATSSDGLSISSTNDSDGDGDTDTATSDITVRNANGSSTRTVIVANGDGSQRGKTVTDSSADGLTDVVRADIDGNGTFETVTTSQLQVAVDGAVTSTVTARAGNETTVLSKTVNWQSADRRASTVSEDVDGDGVFDRITSIAIDDDGARTQTVTTHQANGTVQSIATSQISANGFVSVTTVNADGDLFNEAIVTQTRAFHADGSVSQTVLTQNGDGSLRAKSVATTSDDGLVTTVKTDADGNTVFERTTVSTRVLNADGSVTQTDETRGEGNSVLTRSQTTTSDDGLTVTRREDGDGDGDYDLVSTSTTTLLTNGGTQQLIQLRDATNVLRSSQTITTSDDGRVVTSHLDVNGDGVEDVVSAMVIADNGVRTETVSNKAANAALQSRTETVTSANGLVATSRIDADGDGVYETTGTSQSVLNADGSTTSTASRHAADGSLVTRTITTTSDDGLSATTLEDIGGDGVADFTTVSTRAVAQNGVVTQTSQRQSANGSVIANTSTVISADGRSVTATIDRDGNGVSDLVSVVSKETSGATTNTTTYRSKTGVFDGKETTSISGDGTVKITSIDRDGDGRNDLVRTERVAAGEDGTLGLEVRYSNDRFMNLGQEVRFASDDGLSLEISLDLDGNGVFDFITQDTTHFAADGDYVRHQVTRSASNDTLSDITVTTSGNGLQTTTAADFSGDGSTDRITISENLAGGGSVVSTREFGAGMVTKRESVTTTSADGRNSSTVLDRNGDFIVDQVSVVAIDLDRSLTTTINDYNLQGTLVASASGYSSGNGALARSLFDFDADGDIDLARETLRSSLADGSTRSVLTEATGTRTSLVETKTVSGNGLSVVTQTDIDGDGDIDGTTTSLRSFSADGVRHDLTQTHYANGSLRYKYSSDLSADGAKQTQSTDFDGNGIADQLIEFSVDASGVETQVLRTFNSGGSLTKTTLTQTSADGLVTTVLRGNDLETTQRSAVSGGSYNWDNGVVASTTGTNIKSSHQVDALGIETWTIVSNWVVSTQVWVPPYNNGQDIVGGYWQTQTSAQTAASAARLDAVAKSQILNEARDLFDTIFDREPVASEFEALVRYVTGTQLDRPALASALLQSTEFTQRYGTLSNGEAVTQLYFNSFGRAPSMAELDKSLIGLANGTSTLTSLAVGLAGSAEHLLVGNVHMATNNINIPENPVVYERYLDKAFLAELVESIVDVVYDRDATANELSYLTGRLLTGLDKPDDIAAALLGAEGEIFGTGTASLKGLSGTALVNQAFLNALGREPTAAELGSWVDHLAAGRVSAAQFVASLAIGFDHQMAGNGHQSPGEPQVISWNGTAAADNLSGGIGSDTMSGLAGNDTLSGNSGSDQLAGGLGIDSLNGGAGNDFYVWKKGDGNDVIYDTSTSLVETDTLVLENVNSSEVELSRVNGTNHLTIKVVPTGEIITDQNRFYGTAFGHGLEAIIFADGVTWTLDNILAKTVVNGTSAGETLTGSAWRDNLFGLAGNDALNGNDGNDLLDGGLGLDTLNGGVGDDTYVWKQGDGNDTIYDTSTSLAELDTLVLSDVNSSQVELTRANGSNHLSIKLLVPSVATITDQNRFFGTGHGMEAIRFADGVTWTLDDILAKTLVNGTSAGETLTGSALRDNLLGFAGNDTLNGNDGNDTLNGGTGIDTLNGGAGSDTYVWKQGDGNDIIYDTSTSLVETDTLVLSDVNSNQVELSRINGSNHLTIKMLLPTVETLTDQNRFYATGSGHGLEAITFADGVTWRLPKILSRTWLFGDAAANTLTGTAFADNIKGEGGNDTINGGTGDDLILGSAGADTLEGGDGNDRFEWSKGDGNDVINDNGVPAANRDSLNLANVLSTEAVLARSGNNLTIAIASELLTVNNRFSAAGSSYGVEVIAFADGVTIEVLDSPVAEAIVTGTLAANTLNGWLFKDTILGLEGNDSINGNGGNDRLIGGLGIDTLNGGAGDDTYVWKKFDGNDTLYDSSTSLTEIDTLVFEDVASNDVELTRVHTSNHLAIKIVSTGEIITDQYRFYYTTTGHGMEAISFADGVTWTLKDIQDRTQTRGTDLGDALGGSYLPDNLFGLAGADTLTAYSGDDRLIGGAGNDTLNGMEGNDFYIWKKGDGNDTIYDTSASLVETDTLVLSDVNSGEVELTRTNGTNHLSIKVLPTGEIITDQNRFYGTAFGHGMEAISFADGVTWTLDDIFERTMDNGTGVTDTLTGSAWRDNLFGLGGNDTLNGNDGNDTLDGGLGVDALNGGAGNDTYVWRSGDGDDTITESGGGTDVLRLENINVSNVEISRTAIWNVTIRIMSSGEIITLQSQDYGAAYGIERIEFANGVAWDRPTLMSHAWVRGTTGADSVTGGSVSEIFALGAGNDIAHGMGGDDTYIYARGDGTDTFYDYGGGVDTLRFTDMQATDLTFSRVGAYDIVVKINSSSETITLLYQEWAAGGYGLDQIEFANGEIWNRNDLMASSWFRGSASADAFSGGAYGETMLGEAGNDTLNGNGGDDQLFGGAGADTLNGGDGNDQIFGGSDNDALNGGAGNDHLLGGLGIDTITGGVGYDVFVFENFDTVTDVISDFSNHNDLLDFTALGLGFADFNASTINWSQSTQVWVPPYNNGQDIVGGYWQTNTVSGSHLLLTHTDPGGAMLAVQLNDFSLANYDATDFVV